MKIFLQIVEDYFIPQFDELMLFVISFTCILLFGVSFPNIEWNIQFDTPAESPIFGLIISLLLLSGLVLSIYHAFSSKPKTNIEKRIMVFFAVVVTAFSGIWGGTYILTHEGSWLILFPIWNIFCGMMLLGMLRGNQINEQNLSDVNVKLHNVIFGAVIVSLLFSVCHFVFGLVWAETFSICIVYSTSFGRPTQSILNKVIMKQNQI